MTTTLSDNKRIARNTLFLSVRMLVSMLVSLYTSRVILDALGVENFGIYNVIGGVMSLFAFVNGAMSNATQRYIAFELGKEADARVKRVFSACMMIHLFIALLILVLAETFGLYILNHYLTIPEEKLSAANWVYQISILSCIVMIVNTPYNGAIVAYERMQAFAYISLIEVFLRLGVSLLIVYLPGDKLILYALLLFAVQLSVRLCYTFYCRKKLPIIRFSILWDRSLFRSLSRFMGWTMFNNMSIIACSQGVNILLNIFFNPVVNAARGIAVQVEHAINMFSQNFQMAIKPQIIKSYSMNEKERFEELILSASRLSFFLLLLLAFPILIHIDYILGLWLNEVPAYTADFTRIIIFVSLVNVLAEPLQTGVSASGVIKYFQMVSGVLLVSILPISAFGFQFIHSPLLIFVVYLVMAVLVYAYKLYYCKKHIALSLKQYVLQVLVKVGRVSVVCMVIYAAFYRNPFFSGIVQFLGSFVVSSLLIAITIYLLGLNQNEKSKIICYLKKRLVLKKPFKRR